MIRLITILVLTILLFSAENALSAPGNTLPFTAEEDHDGSRTVWFLLNISGVNSAKHAYTPAKDIPKSNRWLKLKPNEKLQPMDMAWWPNAVALLKDKDSEIYLFKNKSVSMAAQRRCSGSQPFADLTPQKTPSH